MSKTVLSESNTISLMLPMPATTRLKYKICSPIDIESINDEMAGFEASVRVTELATIEVCFDRVIDNKTRQRIDQIMRRLGASPASPNRIVGKDCQPAERLSSLTKPNA